MKLRHYRRLKHTKPIVITAILLVFALISGFCFLKIQPIIYRYAVSKAETIMLNSANESVISVLQNNNITYEDIVNLSNNDEGYVTSLQIDVYKVNYFKSLISNQISKIIDSKEYYEVAIPIGSFLGNSYFAGYGPKIRFKMQLTSTAFVDFKHEFKSAGINQVLHIITVNININGSFVVAGYNKDINANTSAIVAQTVIVGKSPEAFTNVIENEQDNTGGLINDYGAEY